MTSLSVNTVVALALAIRLLTIPLASGSFSDDDDDDDFSGRNPESVLARYDRDPSYDGEVVDSSELSSEEIDGHDVVVVDIERRQIATSRRPVCPTISGGNEICCGKKVFRGRFDYNVRCCGDDFYDTLTARCCDNNTIIVAGDNGGNLRCCGDRLHDILKQICCNGKAYDMKSDRRCCGDKAIYNPRQQICCNGTIADINNQILSCCLEKPYEPSKGHCIEGVVRDKPANSAAVTQVCGRDAIDYKTKICCDGVARDRSPDGMTVCCGTRAISGTSRMCCNGTVVDNPKAMDLCCLKTTFDPNGQVCCDGKVHSRPINSVGTMDYCRTLVAAIRPKAEMAAARHSPYYRCCGQELFTQADQQMCCNGRLHTFATGRERFARSCCAADVYDPSERTCCSGELVSGPRRRCCGRTPYDLNERVCCGGQLFLHDDVPPDRCCVSDGPAIVV